MMQERRPYNKLISIPFYQVVINDSFWAKRQNINRMTAIYHQYNQLEKDHHIDNFRVAAHEKKGTHRGQFYYDSDLYKWLEAACYILHQNEDNNLKRKVDEIIDLILNSQLEDGYINTFYSTNFIERRFTNTTFMHELYCAGHLIQAAIAHYNATSSECLLKAAERFVYLIYEKFMKIKKENPPGHPEIELALMELFYLTNQNKYFILAKDFINRRGKDANSRRYIISQFLNMNSTLIMAKKKTNLDEADEIEDFYANLSIIERIKFYNSILSGKCYQLRTPVRNIVDPVGHAVRAMYLYCAMADIFSETGDESLVKVLKRSWLKINRGKMYITGSIGSIKGIEGFEKDFKLRIKRSYSETCAAIGYLIWNWRMLHITGHAKYSDLIEKILYNSMLVGQSLNGEKYSYDNPLISEGKDERKDWFLCPCCPPNIARTIASLGKYIYSKSENGILINQYIGSTLNCKMHNKDIQIIQESNFPWKGKVKLKIVLDTNQSFNIYLRIPEWSKDTQIEINGELYNENPSPGKYLEIFRNWCDKDEIIIVFEMKPTLIFGDPLVKDIRNKVCISNGPIVYCLEQKDNTDFDIFSAKIQKDISLKVIFQSKILGGVNTIEGIIFPDKKFLAIPYYAWNNRGPDKMQVWHKKV